MKSYDEGNAKMMQMIKGSSFVSPCFVTNAKIAAAQKVQGMPRFFIYSVFKDGSIVFFLLGKVLTSHHAFDIF